MITWAVGDIEARNTVAKTFAAIATWPVTFPVLVIIAITKSVKIAKTT